jgi:hypothetical protein
MTHYRAGSVECKVTMNDPRVTGTLKSTWSIDMWGDGQKGLAVMWGEGRLTTADGAWEGTYSATNTSTTGDILMYWYKGTGAYADLSYVMWERLTPAQVSWSYPVQGIIYPGSPPERYRVTIPTDAGE